MDPRQRRHRVRHPHCGDERRLAADEEQLLDTDARRARSRTAPFSIL
jgi:phage terminase large subunit GpA-like protein